MWTKHGHVKHPSEEKFSSEHISPQPEWIANIIVYVQEVTWSMHFQSIKQNMTVESGNPRGNRDTI